MIPDPSRRVCVFVSLKMHTLSDCSSVMEGILGLMLGGHTGSVRAYWAGCVILHNVIATFG